MSGIVSRRLSGTVGIRLAAALAILALGSATLSNAALAQNAPIQSPPLPPLQQQWLQNGSPPVQQAPTTPLPPSAAMPAPMQPASPPVAVSRPTVGLPATTAKLEALDKVNAGQLSQPPGQPTSRPTTQPKSLPTTPPAPNWPARRPARRPTDQPADAAAFLSVTDSHPDSPGFDGWILKDEPSVSMMQHPVYDLRIAGCA